MELPYDGDTDDPSQYCKPHGVFVGSWWGPDYMCPYCEEGLTARQYYKLMDHQARLAKRKRRLEMEARLEQFDRFDQAFRPYFGWNPGIVAALMLVADTPYYQEAWELVQAG
jgi:hypothetical protein